MDPRVSSDGCGKSRPYRILLCIPLYSVFHPCLFCVDCSEFCRFVFTSNPQHKYPCPRRDSNAQPQQAIGHRPIALDRSATGIGTRSPDRPASTESLYRLRYPYPLTTTRNLDQLQLTEIQVFSHSLPISIPFPNALEGAKFPPWAPPL